MSLSLVRSERRFERFDDTFSECPSRGAKLVRALLGEMPELSLHCLDRRAACDRLARHRMPTHLVPRLLPEDAHAACPRRHPLDQRLVDDDAAGATARY